jgi:hypothetical protein
VKRHYALQKQNAENLKQIFPEKEYRGLIPNFHIHVSVSELYIDPDRLILGIYKYINGIAVAVRSSGHLKPGRLDLTRLCL